MASFARTAARLSARLVMERQKQQLAGFRTSAATLAAQNFTMPALSPTMTQGNIARWKVKEGDSFAAGDVLLEIETDKATMDVEAQDDGVLVSITRGDGSQNIQVGSRIGVLAEAGDDIASLEIPAEEQPPAPSGKGGQQQSAPGEGQKKAGGRRQPPSRETTPGRGSENPPQKYPLYPSVEHLVKEHGLDEAAIRAIAPTGPQGRLLKGDVLAYLGSIDAGRPAAIKARFDHNAHLDLSNIKVAAAAAPSKAAGAGREAKEKEKEGEKPARREELSISQPVSLAAVVEAQRKIEAALGTFLPLSTFIARAVDLANDGLPPAAGRRPSADELFDQVLSLDGGVAAAAAAAAGGGSRGHYLPQIAALNPSPAGAVAAPRPRPAAAKAGEFDVIDFLSGRPTSTNRQQQPRSTAATAAAAAAAAARRNPGFSTIGPNSFTLTVPRAEERRAKTFLQRVKFVLEKDPGRLVL